MGLDYLDMTMRIEREVGCTLDWRGWERSMIETRGRDYQPTAGDVADFVQACVDARQPHQSSRFQCDVLQYESRGGQSKFAGDVWPVVCMAIEDATGISREKIRKTSRIVADLGIG